VGLAECATAHGHLVRAARLSGASAVVLGSAGLTFHPFNIRPEVHERYVSMVRNQLGDEAVAAVRAQGQAMSMDEAVASARPRRTGNRGSVEW